MTGTLSRHLFFRALRLFGIILSGVAGLVIMVDSVELLRLGYGEILGGIAPLIWLAMRRTLVILQTVLPFIMLLTAIFTLIGLNRSRELVVMRAAGQSVWQFLRPLGSAAILCGLFAAFVINPLAASANKTAERDFAQSNATSAAVAADARNTWFRQRSGADTLILGALGRADNGRFLSGVTLLLLDENKQIKMRAEASNAVWSVEGWTLGNASVQRTGSAQENVDSLTLPTSIDSDTLSAQATDPDLTSVFALPAAINQARKTGLATAPYIQAFHAQLAKPLFFLCMVTIASMICLRFGRFGRYDSMVLGGMLGGFLHYIFVEIFDGLGASGALPTFAAVWVPLVVVILAAATVLLHQEDG